MLQLLEAVLTAANCFCQLCCSNKQDKRDKLSNIERVLIVNSGSSALVVHLAAGSIEPDEAA